jgi:hypothetical protein
MPDIAPILDRLNRVRQRLELVASSVPADLWRKPPRPGAWSAAEVIAHLTMVEAAITDSAAKLVRGAPPRVPLWKRLHAPVSLAEWRVIRRKTPIPLDPSLVADKEAMLARLAEQRRRTLALLEEHRGRDLSAYRRKHPFLGSLNYYSWFKMIAHHETRHTEQLREIVETFQK